MAALPTIHETLGAASIGFSLSCGVFGILTTQVFTYYRRYHHDKVGYKCLVALLWLLELVDQIFVGYSIYYYSITQYGNPSVLLLEDVVWPLLAQVVVGNLVGTLVKCCFALRVWRFSHHSLLFTGPILVLILAQLGCAIAYCIRGFHLRKLLFADQLRVVASISLGSGMAADTAIAVSLCWLLHRLRTGFKQSDSIINTLIIYAINTGALTGVISFATLLVYNIFPKSFYFMTFYFILGKLYAISLLCALNTRRSIQGRGTDRQEPSLNTGTSLQGRGAVYLVSPISPTTQSRGMGYPHVHHQHATELKTLEIGVHQEISVSADLERGRSYSK